MDKKKVLTREEVLLKDMNELTAEDLEKLTDEDFSFADLDELDEQETEHCEIGISEEAMRLLEELDCDEEDADADSTEVLKEKQEQDREMFETIREVYRGETGLKGFMKSLKRKVKYYLKERRDAKNREEEVYEPDLIKKYDIIELLKTGTTIGDLFFMVTEYKVYTDRLMLQYSVQKDFETLDDALRVTLPKEEGKRFYEFECKGVPLCWDAFDFRHKTKPAVAEDAWVEATPWVSLAKNQAIRVEKEYAEHNLSEDCLQYAIYESEGYYTWNIEENAWYPVLFELRSLFDGISYDEHGILIMDHQMLNYYNKMQMYNWTYCKNNGLTTSYVRSRYKHPEDGVALTPEEEKNNELILKIMNLQKKDLWTPDEN